MAQFQHHIEALPTRSVYFASFLPFVIFLKLFRGELRLLYLTAFLAPSTVFVACFPPT
ncbi:hypothetical protein BD289DRAFT_436116 [Coniella lustricola]|uniref:Uncharacterized protein n=1 Tax=Coniella lustricola TaxID=2025994 RepID=A0A2T3A5M1_9PEZI|nr:hypothetical protein BD289DRAFT_436116 [Coniella lustricola]